MRCRPAAFSAGALRVSSEPLVVRVRSRPGMAREHADQLLEIAPDQRLAAGQPDFLDAESVKHAREPLDFLERK